MIRKQKKKNPVLCVIAKQIKWHFPETYTGSLKGSSKTVKPGHESKYDWETSNIQTQVLFEGRLWHVSVHPWLLVWCVSVILFPVLFVFFFFFEKKKSLFFLRVQPLVQQM